MGGNPSGAQCGARLAERKFPLSRVVAEVYVLCGFAAFCLGAGLNAASAQTQVAGREPTVQTDIGLWYQPGAPKTSKLWRHGDAGQPLFLQGRVLNTAGRPVNGALVELWHADMDGFVEHGRFRASLTTKGEGLFRLSTVLPGYIWGPRHIHFVVSHSGYKKLITRIFFRRDPVLERTQFQAVVIALEDGKFRDMDALFGDVEFVLEP